MGVDKRRILKTPPKTHKPLKTNSTNLPQIEALDITVRQRAEDLEL